MSLLLCDQFEDAAVLVTDTLTLHGDNDRPAGFRSKVWTLPHMNMVIAMTGTANIGDAWYWHVAMRSGATNIEEINTVAASSLCDIQEMIEKEQGPTGTSTIYHFGFPPGSDKLVRYTYRSKDGYEPEIFTGNQYLAKPTPPGFVLTAPDGVEETIQLAHQLRDECPLKSGAVMVGGELYATRITNWGIQTVRWYRFPDYDEVVAEIQQD